MKLKNWKDVSLNQFIEIQNLLNEPDDYLMFNLLDLVYDIDSASMTVPQLAPYKDALSFLNTSIPHVKLLEEYTLNGTVYESNFDLTVVTVAQFIDYQNYVREEKPSFEKLLSVFFIPKGMEYNKGYDIKKVQDDVKELDMCTISTLTFFFKVQFLMFSNLFQSSLQQTIEKMDLKPREKEEVTKLLEAMSSSNLDSILLS